MDMLCLRRSQQFFFLLCRIFVFFFFIIKLKSCMKIIIIIIIQNFISSFEADIVTHKFCSLLHRCLQMILSAVGCRLLARQIKLHNKYKTLHWIYDLWFSVLFKWKSIDFDSMIQFSNIFSGTKWNSDDWFWLNKHATWCLEHW